MEVNKEEALRCLHIAQKHRNSSNLPSALKFAKKSVSLYETPEGATMISIIEREIESGGSSSASEAATPQAGTSTARATGVEEHLTSAHSRPGHKPSATEEKGKKREYTAKQIEVVKRVKGCKQHQYYEILAGTSSVPVLFADPQSRGNVRKTTSKRPTRSLHWHCIQIKSGSI